MSAAIRKQQGWTFLGLMSILVVAGIFVALGFKLLPAYADHRTLDSILTDTIRDGHLLSKNKYDIKLSISKRLRLNNMTMPKEYLEIEKDKGTVRFLVEYEKRIPIFMNVDALVYFNEVYEGKELE